MWEMRFFDSQCHRYTIQTPISLRQKQHTVLSFNNCIFSLKVNPIFHCLCLIICLTSEKIKRGPIMVKIYVGKLSDDVTNDDLKKLFEQYGSVDEAERVRGRDIGFVHMPNEQMATMAVR